jgi:hypothetical protein
MSASCRLDDLGACLFSTPAANVYQKAHHLRSQGLRRHGWTANYLGNLAATLWHQPLTYSVVPLAGSIGDYCREIRTPSKAGLEDYPDIARASYNEQSAIL